MFKNEIEGIKLINSLILDEIEKNPEMYFEEYEESIAAKMYAEAVKLRNGAVQYGLLSDKLREEKYKDYKNWDFVTGASSPWIDSYEISEIAENKYQITFNYVTSVPTDAHTSSIIINVIENGQYWCIDSITRN